MGFFSVTMASISSISKQRYPEINAKLEVYAKQYGVSPAAIVIAWIMRHPAHMQILLGSTKASRLEDALSGMDIVLEKVEWYDLYRAAGGIIP